MKMLTMGILTAILTVMAVEDLQAQQLVRPRWNYAGSAVCPQDYDYVEPWCRPRYNYGYGRQYEGQYGNRGDRIPPRWNSRGSAVCPTGYDYHASSGFCRPQF